MSFAPSFEATSPETRMAAVAAGLEVQPGGGEEVVELRPRLLDPDLTDQELRGFWFRTHAHKVDARGKELRKQTFIAVVTILRQVRQHAAEMVVGYGQGAVAILAVDTPPIRARALQARGVQEREKGELEAAWLNVMVKIFVRAAVLPWEGRLAELSQHLPELLLPRRAVTYHVVPAVDPGRREALLVAKAYEGAIVSDAEGARKMKQISIPHGDFEKNLSIPEFFLFGIFIN